MLLCAADFMDRYPYLGFLKWVCCPAFAYLATHAWKLKKTGWVWVLGVIAVVYNPIVQVYSVWEMSLIVILATIVIAFALLFVLNSKNQEQ